MSGHAVVQITVDEVKRVRERLAQTELAARDFGSIRPLYPDRLESAVARQDAGFGDARKYTRLHEITATLFFGLVTSHAFDNGNKRTGLVSALALLEKNGSSLGGQVTEDELYEVATRVADWKQTQQWGSTNPDRVVHDLSVWFKSNQTSTRTGFQAMRTKDFLQSLRALGCEVSLPDRSFVRVTPPPQNSSGRITKVVYRDEGREVPARLVKDVRKKLGLTPANGVYETEFFQLEPAVDKFVVKYQEVLRRLADA